MGAGGALCATGGGASVTGSTQFAAGAWAAAATAAAPHRAAAGAPPVKAARVAHGLTDEMGAELDAATAPVELMNRDPATQTPTTPFNFITPLPAFGSVPPATTLLNAQTLTLDKGFNCCSWCCQKVATRRAIPRSGRPLRLPRTLSRHVFGPARRSAFGFQ